MENRTRLIQNRKYWFIIIVLLFTCFSCYYTPKGGGDLIVSASINESKEKGMFKREYTLFPDSIFEYRDSIINIKLVFNDIFVENTHKEIRRIPAYKKKQYYNSGCDSCPEQFTAYFKIESCELKYYDDYWYIDKNRKGGAKLIYTYLTYEDFISDTLSLRILLGNKYKERIGIDYRNFDKICFDTITFVKK